VSQPETSPTIDLRDLRLDEVRALLHSCGAEGSSIAPETDPTGYLQQLIDQLCDLSLKDPLTGLYNRRYFDAELEAEIDRVARSGEAALLLMLDIDHFKSVNDTYGHNAGDQVLQAVAKTLQSCVRPMDTLARFGGEEFAVVLPACMPTFGRTVAERIRRAIEATPIQISPNVDLRVTISVGGAFAQQWIRSTTSLWIERADQQLYVAKSAGRNQLCLETQADSTVSAEEKSLLFGHMASSEPAWIEMTAGAAVGGSVQR